MKKIIGLILVLFTVLTFTACNISSQGNNTGANSGGNESSLPPEVNPSESKILIAYFTLSENISYDGATLNTGASISSSGNVARLAKHIQEYTDGDLFSIAVTNPYPNEYNECLSRANREKAQNARPELKNAVENMNDYDIVFLGYPNWCYTVPMAINTFLESYDFSDKTVIPFCSHGTGGLASSVMDIRAAIPQVKVLNALGISRDETGNSQTKIYNWLDTLGFDNEKTLDKD